jgi:PAS domain S-box-containing protein
MTPAATTRPLAWLSRLTPAAAIVVMLVAVLALVGWSSENAWLMRLSPDGPAMNPLTAAVLILAAVGLLMGSHLPGLATLAPLPARRFCCRACGLLVALIGLLKGTEYVFGVGLAVDRFFPVGAQEVNQMSPNSALSFALAGAALVLMEFESTGGRRPAQVLALICAALALLALVGYAYRIHELYGLRDYIPMAMNTALSFLVLSAGILIAQPERGLMRSLTSSGPGGVLMRRLLPAAILIPGVIGWFCLGGHRDGLIEPAAALALLAVSNMAIFAAGVVATVFLLDRAEARRQVAEESLLAERHLLRELLDHLPDSIFFKDQDSRFTRINRALARRLGLNDPAEAVGKTDFDFFTEEHAQPAFEDEQEVLRTGESFTGKEERETWADGRQRWVLTTRLPLRDPSGASAPRQCASRPRNSSGCCSSRPAKGYTESTPRETARSSTRPAPRCSAIAPTSCAAKTCTT